MSELVADVREQVLYLKELGVDALGVQLAEVSDRNEPTAAAEARQPASGQSISDLRSETAEPISDLKFKIPKRPSHPETDIPKPSETRPAGSRLADLPSLAKRPVSVPRAPEIAVQPTIEFVKKTSNLPEPTETIEQIRSEIGNDCTRCKLSTLGRSQVVNSTGNFSADLMFVGEAPGADEDEQGFPFVGRAGQLLTDIIEKGLQIPRKDVFIGNINRCRPPGNRAPEPDETLACKPFLKREIAVVRPRVIVVLGATAAHNLLETKVPIGKLRGRFHDYLGTKVMPTFHPAYLLRDPHKKREVWEDMKLVREFLASPK